MNLNRQIRRDAANERQTQRDSLTLEAQLKELDYRCGKGEGALKERARLAKAIHLRDNPPKKKVKADKAPEKRVTKQSRNKG